MKVPFKWLKEFADIKQTPPKVADRLTMSGLEVESIEDLGREAVFDIGVTPNRADCLSVVGVAREVSAITGCKFKGLRVKTLKGTGAIKKKLSVSVHKKARCPRYAARIIEDVRVGTSPSWMAARLAACGIRSINNIVDATNYVMLETGQPFHAFDQNDIAGGKIIVRLAEDGAKFTTLDGVVRELTSDDLLICDADGPIALAGVMGGENSEVKYSTTNIVLESAYFEPTGVRRTSKRLGLTSESSRRFERGVDPNNVVNALNRLTELIVETAGGKPSVDLIDVYPKKIVPKRISITSSETNRILGTALKPSQIPKLLKRVGLTVKKPRGESVSVSVPTFRPDLTRPIDLIEEIARIYGYVSINETQPEVRMESLYRPRYFAQENMVKGALIDAGLSEAVLYGFTNPALLEPFQELGPTPVKITNPISQEQGVMCTSLLPGLLDVLKLNLNRQRNDLRFFALQRVFQRPGAVGPSDEPLTLAGIMTGKRYPGSWQSSKEMLDFYDAKGVVESVLDSLHLSESAIYQRGEAPAFLHPGRFAYVLYDGGRVGFVGQLHPNILAMWDLAQDVFVFEMHFEVLAELSQSKAHRFKELPKFPFVTRDISIVLKDHIPLVEVEKVISEGMDELLDDVSVFDLYKGKGVPSGHKSLGIALRFSRDDRTLTDEEVTQAQRNIVGKLSSQLGAELRE
ncbi:MAG: phenylalanine--tRNA ligase subunit beta [Pseudomonadota bacterium]